MSAQKLSGRAPAATRDTMLPFDPFTLDDHASALIERGVMLAPALIMWQYRIARPDAFKAWLGMKEIVLAERRLSQDRLIGDVRYHGTYAVASDPPGLWRTFWGYRSAQAMAEMHRLCSERTPSTTIIQSELIDFVRGLRTFVAEAGEQFFDQDVLVPGALYQSESAAGADTVPPAMAAGPR